MPLKTPKFWHRRNSIISILLIPVSWLYRLGYRLNIMTQGKPYRCKTSVICIGNAIAGGSGKTPSVLAILNVIKKADIAKTPYILTRGYGGNHKDALIVDAKKHTAQDVGDEALLLAQYAPVIVAKNRSDGAKLAEKYKADLILMDDGLQNNHLFKDISFLVVDRQIDFGNNRVIPAGPLRETLSNVLNKTSAVICIGSAFHSDLPVFEAEIKPEKYIKKGQSYMAFAGLGYPEKFKNTLLDMGVNLVGWYSFSDHHNYTERELEHMHDKALNKNSILITTEKDHKRLSKVWQNKIDYLPITLNFKKEEEIAEFIKGRLTQ